jgi:transcriptional regulator with XRE-family HTH domain
VEGIIMDIENIKRKLGLRLKELRLAKGLNQEDLEPLGFSYRYYGKIERGLANVTLETLVRLCEIFEVGLFDLFLFMDTDIEASEDKEAVAVKVAQLLSSKNKKNLKKLRLFLDEIL